ncbi:diguanylate cyclase [Ferribacterium limneticum]|uniref:diguanylate cyclase n=1 Tax=Ferribacterium limneticum TaxID=76259 RepID=UPI001CF9BEBD|nr:diguanylate cyclase [Ferribacterium limneticum]UCV28674.1 diguanylate cyclase [Ferribacterium limneticum]UCV32591.1 diguanylate cyclase [Ferribacterium limneticum]
MNRLTLRHRLLLLTLLPSTLIAIALVAYFTFSGIKTLEGELRLKGMATVRYLAPISEYGIIAGQVEGLHGLAQATVQESGVKAAIVVNQKGRTIAVSGRVSLAADELRQNLSEARQVAETEHWIAFGAPVKRSMSDTDQLFETNTSKPAAPEIIGHVFVEFDKTELANKQRQLLQRGLVIVLFGLLVLAALAIAMADNLAKPVMRLVEAVRGMSSGRLDTRVPTSSSGELGILENGFNEMATRMEEVHHSMQARIEEATAQLAFQARHDALTGLLNRREFEHRLEKALASVQAGGDEFAILFLDLDRFKQVNDTCGYLAGDELLRQMSLLFQGRLREEDTLARLGGDEFSIMLANCTGTRAMQVAEDICGLAAAYRFIWQDKVFAIGASVGITTVNRKVRNINEILAAGDAACHRAKESGRNRVVEQEVTFSQERRHEASNWASRIASALSEDRLLIEAVPLRALQHASGGHIVELTARLNEPGQPPVTLAALIDAAERYDLAPAIDRRLIDTAIAAQARAKRRHRNLHCLVPLSRGSIGSRETIDYIARSLASQNMSGNKLCFVFSEDILTHLTSQAMEFSRQMRTLGCQIGLDDFGGGLSSFSHLRSITPSHVKLSRSLTRDLGGNRASTALLRAVQEITADQHIHSIAEDIDDLETLEQLKDLGIDYAQGKAIAPNEPFEVWFEGAVMRSG